MKPADRLLRSNRQRYQLYREQVGICPLCGCALGDDFEIDHRIPKQRAGPTAYHNLQAVHPFCNRKKGAS